MHPVPLRIGTLIRDNHLDIPLNGTRTSSLSQMPNLEIMSGGPNSQVRILILFPHLRKKRDPSLTYSQYKQYLEKTHMRVVWDDFIRPSLIAATVGDAGGGEKLYGISYEAAEKHANQTGVYRSYGINVRKESLTGMVESMRSLVATQPELADYQDFFFHVYAKDTKATTNTGTANNDYGPALEQWLRAWDIFDLQRANLCDLVFDVGFTFGYAAGLHPETALWVGSHLESALREAGWRKPIQDAWCLTSDSYGLRAEPGAKQGAHMVYVQGYVTEKAATYCGPDRSIGTNISVADAIGPTPKFKIMRGQLETVLEDAGNRSWDARLEFRMSLFAAAEACRRGPDVLLAELLHLQCLMTVPSPLVKSFKLLNIKVSNDNYLICLPSI